MATKNYDDIAKSKIHKPRKRPLTVLVYGRFKKGKTHICATAPNVLILDPENGTDFSHAAAPDVWSIERWEDFDEVYKFLKLGKHSYEYVAFDGMTRFQNMALKFVRLQDEETNLNRKPGLVQQSDFFKANELMKELMNNFHALPLGKIYTAQEKIMDGIVIEEDEEADPAAAQFVPELSPGVRSAVNALVDVIGRTYTVRKEHPQDPSKQITSYRLWLAQSGNYDTGSRSEFQRKLPDFMINPSVPKLAQLIQTGEI